MSVTGGANKYDLDRALKPPSTPSFDSRSPDTPRNSPTINPDYKKTDLKSVAVGDYVRYFDAAGVWRPGGTVDKIDKQSLHLNTTVIRTKKQHSWQVRFADIKEIYIFDKQANAARKAARKTPAAVTPAAQTMDMVGLNVLSGAAEVDLVRRSLQQKIDELTARVDRQQSLIVDLYRVLQQHDLIKIK
jgi:hypothetical protein